MIYMKTILDVADNTGAKKASMIGVSGKKNCRFATIADVITVNVKESAPNAAVKKGEKAKAVIVRTKKEKRRKDGSYIRFDDNAAVVINKDKTMVGTRVFGPVAREIRDLGYLKIASLAKEVW